MGDHEGNASRSIAQTVWGIRQAALLGGVPTSNVGMKHLAAAIICLVGEDVHDSDLVRPDLLAQIPDIAVLSALEAAIASLSMPRIRIEGLDQPDEIAAQHLLLAANFFLSERQRLIERFRRA